MKKLLSTTVAIMLIMTSLGTMSIAASSNDFTVVKGTLIAYTGSDSVVIIPGDLGITKIGDSVFGNSANLTSVTIPDGVTAIGNSVFAYSANLTSVIIPSSVITVGKVAFRGTNISEPIILNNGQTLYYVPTNYTSYTIPDTVTIIANDAFSSCSSLASVTIPNSVTIIGSYAFLFCSSLASVTIPNSVTIIGAYAFSACSSLVSIAIPDSVINIVSGAFYDCSNLISISIPSSVVAIGSVAFYGCNNTTIYGIEGSFAQQYAEQNNISFNVIDTTDIPTPTPTSKPVPTPRSTMTSMTIPQKSIILDGNYGDWSDLKTYTFDTDILSGKPLVCPATMKVAWNGEDTLYIFATLKVSPIGIEQCPTNTTVNWYDYDVFELFMQPTIPSTLAQNQITAYHYAVSDRFLINGPIFGACAALKIDATVMNTEYDSSTKSFSFEMSVPLTGEFMTRVGATNPIYLKFGTEIQNSRGEFSILGYPKMDENAFWNPNNYIECTFMRAQPSILYGDVNNDTVIDNKDLVLFKRYFAGVISSFTNPASADVNNDDVIDNKDLVLVKRYFAGVIAKFPAQP